jgi:hypothetical protein
MKFSSTCFKNVRSNIKNTSMGETCILPSAQVFFFRTWGQSSNKYILSSSVYSFVSLSSFLLQSIWLLDVRGSIPGRGKCFIFSINSRPALGPNQLSTKGAVGAVSQGVKRQNREIDHLPSPSDAVKNDGATFWLPHIHTFSCRGA